MSKVVLLSAAAGSAAALGAAYGCKRCAADVSQAARIEKLQQHRLRDRSDPQNWSATDVAAWLMKQGVSGSAAAVLEEQNIDGTVLPSITPDMLAEMKISKMGDRMKIARAAQDFGEQKSPVSTARQGPSLPASNLSRSSEEDALRAVDRKYERLVAGHVESLQNVAKVISSPDFTTATSHQKRLQLKKVIDLLNNLITFTDELPEKHGRLLLEEIQKVYAEARKHDAAFEDDEENEPADKADSRVRRLLALKKVLEEADDVDLKDATQELRNIVDVEKCTDPRELHVLGEVFELLRSRNERLKATAEALKKQRDALEDEDITRKLLLVAQMLRDEFASQPRRKQVEYLSLAEHVLQKYRDSPEHDPSLSSKLAELISARRSDMEAGKGGNSSSVGSKLEGLIELLQHPNFSNLGIEEQFQILQHAYEALDALSPEEQAANFRLTTLLVGLLKEKHNVMTKHEFFKKEKAEGDDKKAMGAVREDNEKAAQNEVNMLPKVVERLKDDTFAENTSQFELNTLLWVVAQISQVLGEVVPDERFNELMTPVHQMLLLRMEEASSLPPSRVGTVVDDTVRIEEGTTPGTFTALSASESSAASKVIPDAPAPVTETDGEAPQLCAVIVGCDSPGGTEALEIQHLAYMLRKELGYRVLMLTGSDCRKPALEAALRAVETTLFVLRASRGSVEQGIPLNDGTTIDVAWLKQRTPSTAGFVLDLGTSLTAASGPQTLVLDLNLDTPPRISGYACNWLFDGVFTPILAEILSVEGGPTTLHGAFRELQLAIVGRSNNEIIEMQLPESAGLHTCVISRGIVESEDDDEEEEEDDGAVGTREEVEEGEEEKEEEKEVKEGEEVEEDVAGGINGVPEEHGEHEETTEE